MEERIQRIEQEIKAIALRNARVEADKRWETSRFRTVSIAAITYFIATFFLYLINAEHFFLGALVPAVGFVLSMQTLPALKRWWIDKVSQK